MHLGAGQSIVSNLAPNVVALAAFRYHGTPCTRFNVRNPGSGNFVEGVELTPLSPDFISIVASMGSWPPHGSALSERTAAEPSRSYASETNGQAGRSNRMLRSAVERNDIVAATLALGCPDFNVNLPDHHGATPVAHAATWGRTSILQLLLEERGVDVNAKDSYGDTPLALAAGEGHGCAVAALLEHRDIQADSRNSFNVTPLALAAEGGHLRIVKLLLERHDVQADSVDDEGCTPLARAAAMGHAAIVRMLLGRADVTINSRDQDGYTPLAWAARRGHGAVVGALMERQDLDIHLRDDDGWTPLMLALDEGHEDAVQRLAGLVEPEHEPKSVRRSYMTST